MSLNSVNTNVGAMVALQSLAATNVEAARTQQRISTGLKVASVRDNGATWAIAQSQRANQRAFDPVIESLQRGQSVLDVSIAAGETISDLLVRLKEVAMPLLQNDMPNAATLALTADYFDLLDQIDRAAAGATFDGMNLVSSGGTDQIKALASTDGASTIDIPHIDLSTGGAAMTGIRPSGPGGVIISDIDAAITNTAAALAKLGTGAKALESHLSFVRKQQDAVEAGVGRLVDADMAKESARLQSVQVRQQLAVTALGVANRAPSMLSQLFR